MALLGWFDLTHMDPLATHAEPKSAVLRLVVSHGWRMRSPTMDTPQGERNCVGGCGEIGQTKDERRNMWVCRGTDASEDKGNSSVRTEHQ